MAIVNKPNTFSSSTTISSSQVNDNFDTIYSEFNGNIAAANLATDSVTTAKIADSNVTTGKIADSAVTTAKLLDGGVTGAKLATSAITLGQASITSSVTTTSNGTAVQATGLTATVTIPSGGRKVRVSAYIPRAQHNAVSYFIGSLWDGTVGSGTQLVDSPVYQATAANTGGSLFLSAIVTPSAGSKTYNVGFHGLTGNTTSITCSSTSPAYILVEAI